MPFHSIRGQKHALEYLRRSIQNQRVAHAFLFTGPEGVGKRTTAIALAQVLNCQETENQDACGLCNTCRRIEEGLHPDVHSIVPDGQSIKIEQIRETVQREAILKPMEGKNKVYILDPANALTLEAANSLLKLLEEPPANVVLILVTTQPFALLETIRSRCQEIRFHPVEKEAMKQWLEARLSCTEAQAATLAMLSGGRPAEALRLADEEQKGLREQVLQLVQQSKDLEWEACAQQLGELRAELPEIFGLLLTWYRDLLVLVQGGEKALIINQDHWEALQRSATQESAEGLQEKCRSVLQAAEQLKRNINVQLLLENLFLRLNNPLQAI
jgi:DNA polymerase III subunit delta'